MKDNQFLKIRRNGDRVEFELFEKGEEIVIQADFLPYIWRKPDKYVQQSILAFQIDEMKSKKTLVWFFEAFIKQGLYMLEEM